MSIINPTPIGANLDTFEQLATWVNDLGGGNALAALESVINNAPNAPTFTTVTLTSGTAAQNAGTAKQKYFIGITGGTAGTVKVDISPDNFTTTHNLIPATAANAVASQTLVVDVPAGWYIKVTVSVATIVASSVVATGL
jgi:hypothetical protein